MVVIALILMLIGCWLLTTQTTTTRAPEHHAEISAGGLRTEGHTGDDLES
jgi:hypothetical protein